MAKSELNDVTETDCCNACRAQQLCIAWQYISNNSSDSSESDSNSGSCSLKSYVPNSQDYHLAVLQDANGVFGILNNVKEWQTFVDKMYKKSVPIESIPTLTPNHFQLSVGAIVPAEERHPAPRAIILHGTSCVHRNETVQYRDVNTMWIGRYMLERGELIKSINIDEYSVTACSAMVDEIWVPTEWHRAHLGVTLRKMGQKAPAIYVIPEAVDVDLFDPNDVDITSDTGVDANDVEVDVDGKGTVTVTSDVRPFIFLSIFKWEYRKGWDVLLDSYWNAFSASDPVELHIHTYLPRFQSGNPNITLRIETHARSVFGVQNLDELAKVVWINGFEEDHENDVDTSISIKDSSDNSDSDNDAYEEYRNNIGVMTKKRKAKSYSRADMRQLLADADAFVLPTRGEGWGLPIAEAMSMSLPVLVTNCSGPMAYLTEDNSYSIPIGAELDDYGYAEPVEEVLIQLLRTVFNTEKKLPGTGAIRSLKGIAARETMKSISPSVIADKIQERLRALAEMRGWKM